MFGLLPERQCTCLWYSLKIPVHSMKADQPPAPSPSSQLTFLFKTCPHQWTAGQILFSTILNTHVTEPRLIYTNLSRVIGQASGLQWTPPPQGRIQTLHSTTVSTDLQLYWFLSPPPVNVESISHACDARRERRQQALNVQLENADLPGSAEDAKGRRACSQTHTPGRPRRCHAYPDRIHSHPQAVPRAKHRETGRGLPAPSIHPSINKHSHMMLYASSDLLPFTDCAFKQVIHMHALSLHINLSKLACTLNAVCT